MNEYDNYDITIEECEYDGCSKKIAVCACCEDKNNLKYHFICDICRRLFCIGHKYYMYNTCPQNQTWDTVCRNCIPTQPYYTISQSNEKFDSIDMHICSNYSVCGELVREDSYKYVPKKYLCAKCSGK